MELVLRVVVPSQAKPWSVFCPSLLEAKKAKQGRTSGDPRALAPQTRKRERQGGAALCRSPPLLPKATPEQQAPLSPVQRPSAPAETSCRRLQLVTHGTA